MEENIWHAEEEENIWSVEKKKNGEGKGGKYSEKEKSRNGDTLGPVELIV